MRALVTGGAGLIGSHLVDLLLEEGWDVRILDNFDPLVHPDGQPQWTKRHAGIGVGVRRGDVCDVAAVTRAMKGVHVVFHQAAFTGFAPEWGRYFDVNVTGTANVLRAAEEEGVHKVVVASSQAVYPVKRRINWQSGVDTEPYAHREDDELDPSASPYALSKYAEEKLALMFGRQTGLPVVALRYALTYGPRQSVSNPYTGICSIFATQLRNGRAPVIYEDGLQTRCFTFVEDVARANLLVAGDRRADGRVFNVSTGVSTTVLAFEAALWEALNAFGPPRPGGRVEPVLSGTWRPVDARHVLSDPSRLIRLGWQPKVSLTEGLRRYASWFMAQPCPRPVFDKAESEMVVAGIVVA